VGQKADQWLRLDDELHGMVWRFRDLSFLKSEYVAGNSMWLDPLAGLLSLASGTPDGWGSF